MGDDLTFARKFTQTAAEGLTLLSDMDDPRASDAAPVVTAMMTTLQTGAKRLRARHIYTSAQGVLSALHHSDDDVLTGRIEALGSLVTEYARGLGELVGAETLQPVQTPHDKWETARANLDALLPIASPDHADALSRLMRAPVQVQDLREDAPAADVLAFPSAMPTLDEVGPVTLPEPEEPAVLELDGFELPEEIVAPPAAARNSDAPQISLDILMRDVVSDALSVARSVNRTISLSYDMADAVIAEDLSEDLRDRLGRALAQIIRQAMPEGRVGHIDVNVAGEQMHIMAGTTALRVAIDPASVTPAPRPMITPESEHGLRAQLDALMDPQAGFNTAS